MRMTTSQSGPQGPATLQIHRAGWMVILAGACWAGLLFTAMAVLFHH